MALEAVSTDELFNIIVYDTICATPYSYNYSSGTSLLPESSLQSPEFGGASKNSCPLVQQCFPVGPDATHCRRAVQGRRKRRRRPKVCKNREEAETQRMTHIAVERNRRKQMNEHLGLLRSLMPQSYVKRGDQASIVSGAIEYVKELEYFLQSLEAKKNLLPQEGRAPHDIATATATAAATTTTTELLSAPFAQFFVHPQYTWSQIPYKNTTKGNASVADIEVTLIETHANLRILLRKSLRQLSKLVAGFYTLYLTILHLNVSTLEPLVLYSISAKVEEGCQLTSADDIAGAVHHMVTIIEEEATLC